MFISNEDINDIKIIKSLEDSGVLIDGVTETVKHEINKKVGFLVLFSNFVCFIGTVCDFFNSKKD